MLGIFTPVDVIAFDNRYFLIAIRRLGNMLSEQNIRLKFIYIAWIIISIRGIILLRRVLIKYRTHIDWRSTTFHPTRYLSVIDIHNLFLLRIQRGSGILYNIIFLFNRTLRLLLLVRIRFEILRRRNILLGNF